MIHEQKITQTDKILNATVIVTGLGYLVDVYDMLIFNVTRVASLTDLGLSGAALTDAGLFILNMQLLGFLLGGIFFGILGDKLGRKQSLLGSILLYSVATLACAFVQDVGVYAALRFIAGFGLAGEIGVGVALISEVMTKEKRALGITLFGFLGISGAVLAAIAAETLDWRVCYIIGGVAGLALLLTRSMLLESGLYQNIKHEEVKKGSFITLLTSKPLLKKYIAAILLGAPIFFVIGMIWTLSPEIGLALGIQTKISAPITIGIGYAALMAGDVLAGLLSHYFKTRKKTIFYFLISTSLLLIFLLIQKNPSAEFYYILSGLLGLSIGYWVNLISLGAEQFGTNVRATAATSIPNFARATLLPLNIMLAAVKPEIGIIYGVAIMGAIALCCAFISLYFLEETHGKDLDYTD